MKEETDLCSSGGLASSAAEVTPGDARGLDHEELGARAIDATKEGGTAKGADVAVKGIRLRQN